MGFHFGTTFLHFRRKLLFQNLFLKTQVIFSSFSTLQFYRKNIPLIFQECSKKKLHKPGRQAHARMIVSGFKPTVVDATCLLQMYIKCSNLKCAAKVFDRMSEKNCVSWTTMIIGYSTTGKMGLAQSLFDLMPAREVISWTSLMSGYFQNGSCLKSVEVFVMMRRDAVPYNETAFSVVLRAIANMKDNVIGVQVHGVVVKSGFEKYLFVGNAMLSMYAKCQMLDDSVRFFDGMPAKDLVSWSVIISGSVENEKLESGIEFFKEMQREGVGVDQAIYATVFKCCAGLSDSRLGSQLHGHALKSDVGADSVVGSAILNMYAKCDDLHNATKVFNFLPNRTMQSYTALIVGYARGDHGFEGMQLFLQLLKSDLGFDEISLSVAFSSCAASKELQAGNQLHGLAFKTPFYDDIYVANAILDMYGKCGALPEAFHIFDEMKSRSVVSWTTMVCACAGHGYGNEALQVFEKMVVEKVIPGHATFTGVLHACAHSGLVDEALHYLCLMRSRYGLEPKLIHYSCVVDTLGRSGRIIDALKLIEDMPFEAHDAIWISLLSNCKMQGNVKVAEIAANSLLRLNPQGDTAYVLLSQIYADAGMRDEACKMRRMMRSCGLEKQPGCSWIEVSSV